MKNLLLIVFMTIGITSFSQTIKKEDTTEICLPYTVGKQIMLDLNKLDSTTAILKLTEGEVIELNKKIDLQQSVITTMEEKVKTSETIIQKTNEKFQIVDNINKDLTSDNKKLKRKNTIIQIVSAVIIGALTQADKREIETLIKKEIKDFLGSSTAKQFEDKLVERISKEMKRGKLEKDVKELIIKSFREFYTIMYQQRSFWESKFKSS